MNQSSNVAQLAARAPRRVRPRLGSVRLHLLRVFIFAIYDYI